MSPLEWSHHFLMTDYASLAELEGKNTVHILRFAKLLLNLKGISTI